MRAEPTHDAGFTLIEVLAALAIFAISILGLLGSINQATASTTEIEMRTLASIVAENRIAEFRSVCGAERSIQSNSQFLNLTDCIRNGEETGEQQVLDQTFEWRMLRQETPDDRIRELIVSVSQDDRTFVTRRTFYRDPRSSVREVNVE